MNTPDKIYIAETPNKLIEIWSDEPIEPKPYITEHEYIRKDALLEWAKAELSHANANIEAYPYEDAYRGHREKIEELIAHIESL